MRNYQKAIAAVLTNVLILGGPIGLNINVSPEIVAASAVIINGIFVWAVPNINSGSE